MTAVALPKTLDEAMAWLGALTADDWWNAALGALTMAIAGLAFVGLVAIVAGAVRIRRR